MADVSGANIRIGANADGAISELERLRSKFVLFSREMNTKVSGAYKSATSELNVYRQGLSKLSSDLSSLARKFLLFAALPTLFAGAQAYKDFAEVQRLERGLAQYGETLEKVRRLAKEPNIGVFDGAKALIGLRAARVESQLAERAVRSFANAITLGGGSSADLEPALFNLKQFKATNNINQVDLRQLGNRVPQTMQAIENAFGTLDPSKLNALGIDKFIEGFISELEKLPKASGGASVSMEQLADSFTFASAAIGEGLDRTFGISDKISSLGGVLDSLAINFKALTPEAQKSIIWLTSLGVIIPVVISGVAALVALWPLMAAAFAAGTLPVSGVLALAAGLAVVGATIGGLIGIYPLLSDKTSEYRKQQELLAGIAPRLGPLIEQYDKLKAIINPSVEDQTKLKNVISQIANLVPSAATGWDSYGKAIDINKSKIAAFTGELKKTLTSLGEVRREQLALDNQRDRSRANVLKQELVTGTRKVTSNLGLGVFATNDVKLSPQEILKSAEAFKELTSRIQEAGKESLEMGSSGLINRVNAVKELELQRLAIRKQISSLSGGYITTAELTQINTLKNKADALTKQIDAQKPKIAAAVKEFNLAARETKPGVTKKGIEKETAISAMGVTQLEEKIKSLKEAYDALDPTAKNYRDRQKELVAQAREAARYLEAQKKPFDDATAKTKAQSAAIKELTEKGHILKGIDLTKKYYEEVAAIKNATKEYKELVGVTANLTLKRLALNNSFLESGKTTVGNTLSSGLDRARKQMDAVGDKRMSDSLYNLNKNSKFDQLRERGALDLKSIIPRKIDINDAREFFEGFKKLANQTAEEYEASIDMFLSATDRLSNYIPKSMGKSSILNFLKDMSPKAGESAKEYEQRINKVVDLTAAMGQGLTSALQNAAASAAEAFGELLGSLGTGTGGIKEFANRLLGTLASMLKDMGKALIAAGTGAIALKVLGKNPYLAVAAGIGLVALGALTQNKLQSSASTATRKLAKGGGVFSEMQAIVGDNPNARFDPEIVVPYSQMEKTIHAGMQKMGGNREIFIPETRIQGSDIVIAYKRAQSSNVNLRGF